MNNLSGAPAIFELNPYEQHNVQMHQLGARGVAPNGDIYRYTRLAADVSAGYLLTALAKEANHVNLALSAAAAIGDKVIYPTTGATAVDAHEYDEGIVNFNDVSPEGEWYTISAHEANAGSLVTTVHISPSLKTAATTSSEVSLIRNPWNRPAVSQLIAERAAGVTVQDWDVSANDYGWLKTRGLCSVLVDTQNITKGYRATISDSVNGAVGVMSDLDAECEVGQMIDTGTATEFNAIYLTID